MEVDLEHELEIAEIKAWAALAGYKFMMFGYWCAIWVHVNRMGGFKKPNPFKPLVDLARAVNDDKIAKNPLVQTLRR